MEEVCEIAQAMKAKTSAAAAQARAAAQAQAGGQPPQQQEQEQGQKPPSQQQQQQQQQGRQPQHDEGKEVPSARELEEEAWSKQQDSTRRRGGSGDEGGAVATPETARREGARFEERELNSADRSRRNTNGARHGDWQQPNSAMGPEPGMARPGTSSQVQFKSKFNQKYSFLFHFHCYFISFALLHLWWGNLLPTVGTTIIRPLSLSSDGFNLLVPYELTY